VHRLRPERRGGVRQRLRPSSRGTVLPGRKKDGFGAVGWRKRVAGMTLNEALPDNLELSSNERKFRFLIEARYGDRHMGFDDLITERPPPPNRVGTAHNEHEHHFYEGAVMVAYAMHLLRTQRVAEVRIHPDGEHAKKFPFSDWLARRGFKMVAPSGRTSYGGTYADDLGRKIIVNPKSGLGDVVAEVRGTIISAECKGGIINTRHPGQKSKLDKGLCETIGRLMAVPPKGRQVAVVPYTEQTLRLATRLAPRCSQAGIEIALVKRRGEIIDVRAT
jgi:hypothetical protein